MINGRAALPASPSATNDTSPEPPPVSLNGTPPGPPPASLGALLDPPPVLLSGAPPESPAALLGAPLEPLPVLFHDASPEPQPVSNLKTLVGAPASRLPSELPPVDRGDGLDSVSLGLPPTSDWSLTPWPRVGKRLRVALREGIRSTMNYIYIYLSIYI